MSDKKSYRKIVLQRSQIRKFFHIPEDVEISTVYVETDPLSLQVLLVADRDNMPWPEAAFGGYTDEGIEDSESQILPYDVFGKWLNQ